MTYDAWFAQYMSLYKSGLKPRTLEEYHRMHRAYIAPTLGPLELEAITPELIQMLLIRTGDHGSRQAQAVYALVRATLRRAVRSRLLLWSPVDAVDMPAHDKEQGKQLTDADYAAALAPIRADLPLSLALFAGLRRGEIAGLRWGDVDLQHDTLHIRRQRQRVNGQIMTITPKSASGQRDVPIADDLLPILRARYMLRPSCYVLDAAPEFPSRCWSRIQRDEVTLSQHYRLHDLRHTYGSRLILAGCNLRVVQYLMGHSSLDVTMRIYSHCSADQAAREVRRISTLTAL